MNGAGDSQSICERDYRDKNDVSENARREDAAIKVLEHTKRDYTKDLLSNAKKQFFLLEHKSHIDFVEVVGEYVISSGRNHEINVWNAVEGKLVSRLLGHTAPVTGLSVFSSGDPPEHAIISSSEDTSIRVWLLSKGEELRKYETEDVITCMAVMKRIVINGNNKGYIEVRHLDSGNLYTKFLAHVDPVDAIVAENHHACSATFEAPSCLKVWDIAYERIVCIYRIENSLAIEFCCVEIWKTMVIVGESNQQRMQVINFQTDEKEVIDLKRAFGKVLRVKVWNGLVLSCSMHKREVILDIHRIDNYECLGIFNCNMHSVNAIGAMEFDNCLKVILGGSALQVFDFEFVTPEDKTKIPFNKAKMDKPSPQNTKKSLYTLRSIIENEHYGNTSFSKSEDETDGPNNYTSSVLPNLQSDSGKMQNKQHQNANDELGITAVSRRKSILTISSNSAIVNPGMKKKLPLDNKSHTTGQIIGFPTLTEPRVAIKKLEDHLNKKEFTNESGGFETKYENKSKMDYAVLMKEQTQNKLEKPEEVKMEEVRKPDKVKASTKEMIKNATGGLNRLSVVSNDHPRQHFEAVSEEMLDNGTQKNPNYSNRFCFTKNKGVKTKKRASPKSKNMTCTCTVI